MRRSYFRRIGLVALALLLGILIVVAGNAATALFIGAPIVGTDRFGSIDAPDVAVLHLIFTALPMVVLAVRGDERPPMWTAAVLLTSAFWGYFAWQIWRDSLTGFAGGANIGLGMIMIASPFVVLAAMKGVSMFLRRGE